MGMGSEWDTERPFKSVEIWGWGFDFYHLKIKIKILFKNLKARNLYKKTQ